MSLDGCETLKYKLIAFYTSNWFILTLRADLLLCKSLPAAILMIYVKNQKCESDRQNVEVLPRTLGHGSDDELRVSPGRT